MVRHYILAALIGLIGIIGIVGPGVDRAAMAKGVTAPAPAPAPVPAVAADSNTVQPLAPSLGVDRLTIAEGLPNSNVKAIAQDQRGFIWFGTQDGLARYDGITMRVYRPVTDDPTSISAPDVTALTLDVSGDLWIATAEHGVNLYHSDTDSFTRFNSSGGKGALGSEGVIAIVRDSKDQIWLTLSDGGLNRYEPATKTFVDYSTKPLDVVMTAIDVDKAGIVWLGTANEGVLRWNPSDNTTVSFRPTPGDDRGLGAAPITSILALPTGKILVGSDGDGLFVLDPATRTVTRHRHEQGKPATLSDDHITVLFEDKRHNVWVGTNSGLNQMDPSGKIVQYLYDHDDPASIPSPGVEALYQDAGGVMWVGGFTVGVGKFDEFRQKFGHHRMRTYANAFFEDTDGTLWVGSYNDGLYKYTRGTQRVVIYHTLKPTRPGDRPLALNTGWIAAIHRDRSGTLWISLKGHGLIAFDPKTESYVEYVPDPENPNSLPVDTIYDIWEDDKGLLWLASWGAGLVRFDPRAQVFTSYADSASGLTSNHLYVLYPDPADPQILWLGTAKGGLVRFNIVAGTATSFRNRADDPTSLSSDDVLTIYKDAAGTAWVGTYGGGLNRLDLATGKAQRFTVSNSKLTNDAVFGILPDQTDKLWLSTNGGGLLQFDPKAGTFLVYGSSDGLQDNEFSQGAFLRSKSGELFFGGVNGFNAFFPKNITRDSYVPPLVMTAFKMFNQEVKLDRPIWTLPPLEVSYSDSFEMQFAALSFAAPQKNRYAFKLEGFDEDFIETDRPYATYTKLGGGKYTLRVRAANQHGVWNETGIELEVDVTPPLWRTSRAYGVYLLLFAGLIYLLFRLQRQRLRRVEREGRLAVVERDLELIGIVQTGFLPEHNQISTARVELVGLYRPADACGGDWWWHEQISGGRHVIMVGDVTGHGPGPAMVTAAIATTFRVLIENGLDDVRRALDLLNREVLRVGKGRYHMTMAALELDEATGRWTLHSAGAPPVLTLSAAGKHKVHFCPGAPLGTEVGFETGHVEGKLEPFDRILMYTDGIPEVALPNGNAMGMRRFAQQFELTRGQGLPDASAAIVVYADQARAGQPQDDDWTFAMIEWR